MPVPTIYTEKSLADFMHDQLGEVAELVNGGLVVGVSDAGSYKEAVNETLIVYGVSDIIYANDIKKLRALARREVWRKVMEATAGNYRFGSDREQYYRNEIYDHAEKQFARASDAAVSYDTDDARYNVKIIAIRDLTDPYVNYDLEDKAGV